ncbi:hypothetical protein [Rubrivirga marina]|uniref:hypothetical protein n=1 Tax=Rubrivirga marina TaxID=1196024 RepID=UPI0015CBB56C|nr:hypothetical protein [Rubrivirga marina]
MYDPCPYRRLADLALFIRSALQRGPEGGAALLAEIQEAEERILTILRGLVG